MHSSHGAIKRHPFNITGDRSSSLNHADGLNKSISHSDAQLALPLAGSSHTLCALSSPYHTLAGEQHSGEKCLEKLMREGTDLSGYIGAWS